MFHGIASDRRTIGLVDNDAVVVILSEDMPSFSRPHSIILFDIRLSQPLLTVGNSRSHRCSEDVTVSKEIGQRNSDNRLVVPQIMKSRIAPPYCN